MFKGGPSSNRASHPCMLLKPWPGLASCSLNMWTHVQSGHSLAGFSLFGGISALQSKSDSFFHARYVSRVERALTPSLTPPRGHSRSQFPHLHVVWQNPPSGPLDRSPRSLLSLSPSVPSSKTNTMVCSVPPLSVARLGTESYLCHVDVLWGTKTGPPSRTFPGSVKSRRKEQRIT